MLVREFRVTWCDAEPGGTASWTPRELENTRTIHTDLFLMGSYKALRSDPCLVNTT